VPNVILVSHLRCKKCDVEFDYAYLPGASVTSFRLGRSRLMRCPNCKRWTTFNLHDTRVDPATHHCELRFGPS
jgi:hypothetical protein